MKPREIAEELYKLKTRDRGKHLALLPADVQVEVREHLNNLRLRGIAQGRANSTKGHPWRRG